MRQSWKQETGLYVNRTKALGPLLLQAQMDLNSLRLTLPLPVHPDEHSMKLIQLVVFATGCVRRALELAEGAFRLSQEGNFTSACLNVRLLYEYWGALHFAEQLATEVMDGRDLAELGPKCDRLTAGSRVPVRLPWGGETSAKSYNVMNFVRGLENVRKDAVAEYEFLCEACHPSAFQQFYIWMAGSAGDNWDNDVFATCAHSLLERVSAAGEHAAYGIAASSNATARVVRPKLEVCRVIPPLRPS